MSRIAEYTELDATALAELVRKGEVTPEELTEAAIAQIEAHNPTLNCVVHTDFDRARKQAADGLPDGPFRGVPFLLKDLLGEDTGQPSTSSSKLMADWRAPHDSELVKRFKAAGLNILGRTNTPEFGIYAVTEPEFRGPARNPWNPDHTPGGSSGGAGAAVAARMVPVAHGGDGGGSIRIPAAHNGLVGLKASRGLMPTGPDRGERWAGFVSEGVLTRSVRDAAAVYDAVVGSDLGAPYAAPSMPSTFLAAIQTPPSKLRIAVTTDALFGKDTHADNVAAAQHTAKLLESLGHEVEVARPTFDKEALVKAYLVVVSAGVNLGVRQVAEKAGRSVTHHDFELSTWALKLIADKVTAGEYVHHLDVIHRETRRVAEFFTRYDVLLTPTAAIPPVPVGTFALKAAERLQIRLLAKLPLRKLLDLALDELAGNALNATPNTMLFNQTGQPAISVPMYWNEAGLPIGSQLVGSFGSEPTLLALAAQLEQAQPWAHRRPAILG